MSFMEMRTMLFTEPIAGSSSSTKELTRKKHSSSIEEVKGKKPQKDWPMHNVSWRGAQTFIAKLNQREKTGKYRLPTEAEWEYACRAGSTTRFCFGNDEDRLSVYAWYRKQYIRMDERSANTLCSPLVN